MKATDDIWAAWGGIGGVQSMLPVLLTHAVHRRGMPLTRLVSLVAANPARRLGLYPRKGSLELGADGDLVLVDLNREWALAPADLHTRWPLNPFVDATFQGQVVTTILRGDVIYARTQVVGAPGAGHEVARG
jgi:allantoinase